MSVAINVDLDKVVARIKETAARANKEEDLRFGVEKVLSDWVLEPLGIPPAKYEVATRKFGTLITGARLDALLGHVVIEYEAPHSLEIRRNYDHAVQQVREGIVRHSQGVAADLPRYFGIVLDGFSIGFVRYRQRLENFEVSKKPLEVNRNTVARLVEAIIGLKRKALDATELLKDFGPGSELSQKVIRVLYDKLNGETTSRTSILFKDWKRVFSQVCAYDPEKLKGLEEQYDFPKGKADVEKLLFSLHSYFALLMKLLGAEVASLYWPIMGSYLKVLEEAYYQGVDSLKEQLRELEEGGIFAKLGISNFLEGDYFAWYLDEWDKKLAESASKVIAKLSEYDPSTAELEPDKIKDLFKHLYQNLVPRRIRHDLGEFYTPDWLAELVMDEVGLTGNSLERASGHADDHLGPLDVRVLDPTCGSGTFLILAIKRLREYVEEHWIDKGTALRKMTSNVVGFDLNPLAVMASRTNYLISIGDLLREKGGEQIEIPVYLADSVLVERRTTVLGTSTYSLKTVAGEFRIPMGIVENGSLGKVLALTEECVRLAYPVKDFLASLQKEVALKEDEVSVLQDLYTTLSKLEHEKRNRIWLRILKNSFAPLLMGRFDYIVGNPPWINWEYLPESYRKVTEPLWDTYGLRRHTKGAGLGKVKRDVAMLFVTVSADRYLKDSGTLGLLIPFTLFKNQTGAGLRMFLAYKCQTREVHDLVTLAPFEGALNRTSLVILGRGSTKFPVSCTSWTRLSEAIPFDAELDDVEKMSERHPMVLEPIEGTNSPGSSWFMAKPGAVSAIRKALGVSAYKANAGVFVGLNGIYWITVLSRPSKTELTIRNLTERGKTVLRETTANVELDLVYPLIRGRDVERWKSAPSGFVIIPHDPRSGMPLSESVIRRDYRKTFAFLSGFKKELENRPIQKLWGKARPFYSLYDIGDYSFTPYKVVWKEIAGKISGKGKFSVAVVGPSEVQGEKRVAICDHKLMAIPFKIEDEAHYVAAILNSSIAQLIVAAYTIETAMDTHVLRHIKIHRFDPQKKQHNELVSLSKQAHALAAEKKAAELEAVESRLDEIILELYTLTQREIAEVKDSLSILMGDEQGEEESEE